MSIVRLTVTHSRSKIVVQEKRFRRTQTILEVKQTLSTHFPTPPNEMRLELISPTGIMVETNLQDEKSLGYYQVQDDFVIHVVDLQPTSVTLSENYDDVSKVEKYTISEADYAKRTDNVRAFKEQMITQQRAEMEKAGIELPPELNDHSYEEAAEGMKVGDRCECQPGDRLGAVRYVGRIAALKPGYWIGVEFDEPVGKGDGSVKGARVFECRPQYGGFLRPDQVKVGDYPPEEF